VVVPDLRELDFGELEGLSHSEVRARYPELLSWAVAPSGVSFPGGESVVQLHRRAVAATREIAAAHAGTTAILVSHSVTLRAILAEALGLAIDNMFRLDIPHCSISVVDWYDETPYVRCVNGGIPAA
jgi:probable phosphoglycerate mutase